MDLLSVTQGLAPALMKYLFGKESAEEVFTCFICCLHLSLHVISPCLSVGLMETGLLKIFIICTHFTINLAVHIHILRRQGPPPYTFLLSSRL